VFLRLCETADVVLSNFTPGTMDGWGLGYDGSPPSPVAAVIAEHSGSQNLVTGVLAALLERTRSGRGQRVDVSLLGAMVWAQASEFTHMFVNGKPAGRSNGGHPMIWGTYGCSAPPTATSRWWASRPTGSRPSAGLSSAPTWPTTPGSRRRASPR
jgi:crotonobetainyl-CoA:carnitine CoA-transferase CaiB-like acyl-CoA transferase